MTGKLVPGPLRTLIDALVMVKAAASGVGLGASVGGGAVGVGGSGVGLLGWAAAAGCCRRMTARSG